MEDDMRCEIQLWFDQASQDLDNARKNIEIQAYYVAVFLAQQAVEKMLKGYFLYTKRQSAGQTYSLVYLASALDIPQQFMSFLKELTPTFINTRYPDIADEAPFNLYDKESATRIVYGAEEVIVWIQSRLNK